MSNRGRPSIELSLDRATELARKIGIGAAAEQLGVSRKILRKHLDAAGFISTPIRTRKKKPEFSTKKCDPPYSCFECPYPDCVRPEPTGAKPTAGERAFAAVIKTNSKKVQI